jgi:hypothetical protein
MQSRLKTCKKSGDTSTYGDSLTSSQPNSHTRMNFLHIKSAELAPDYEPGSPVIELSSTAPAEMSDIQRVTLSVASDEPTSTDEQAATAMPTVTDERECKSR